MKLLTFQHKTILDDIRDTGVYLCERQSDYHLNTPNAYAFLKSRLAGQYPQAFKNVIFAWQQLFKDTPLTIEHAVRGFECTGFDTDNYYLFELDVYDKHVFLTNFYNFVDLRCQEEGIDDIFPDTDYSYSYNEKIALLENCVLDISTHDEVQAIIPYIQKENIISIYSIDCDNYGLVIKEPIALK